MATDDSHASCQPMKLTYGGGATDPGTVGSGHSRCPSLLMQLSNEHWQLPETAADIKNSSSKRLPSVTPCDEMVLMLIQLQLIGQEAGKGVHHSLGNVNMPEQATSAAMTPTWCC
jgi:hypothetical protein